MQAQDSGLMGAFLFVNALQEKLTWELAGTKGVKSSDGKSLPANMFLGHFMKPYFKDKTSGIVSITF